MSYIRHILQAGEQVRYMAKIHWITYVPALLEFFAGAVLVIVAQASSAPVLYYIAVLVLVVALIHFLVLWIVRWTTEIAVTDRRVIYKTGLISRETNEMNMDKVESVKVDQSILGRLLDYGDVTVLGTGAGFEPLRKVDAPLSLRNHITGV
jgi:uncharacterized membrane protein YdbT with pleckstrin-like domain